MFTLVLISNIYDYLLDMKKDLTQNARSITLELIQTFPTALTFARYNTCSQSALSQ